MKIRKSQSPLAAAEVARVMEVEVEAEAGEEEGRKTGGAASLRFAFLTSPVEMCPIANLTFFSHILLVTFATAHWMSFLHYLHCPVSSGRFPMG